MIYDLFNGDADGICALLQLRLSNPAKSELITGVKRDISLLKKIEPSANDQINVLDVSMDKNKEALVAALETGASVFYVDHHFPGDIPNNPNLTAIIDETPDVCTAILVNAHLKDQQIRWAITGAFGDNLKVSARKLAERTAIGESELSLLDKLGTYINYNGYGASLEDLHFTPTDLYLALYEAKDPFAFINESEQFKQLESGYSDDFAKVGSLAPISSNASTAVFNLPDQPWARRVSGTFGNDLANQHPERAHAILTEKENGNFLVSVRAPLKNKTGAVDLCKQFPTGGGRQAAAGINDLPNSQVDDFVKAFEAQYQ